MTLFSKIVALWILLACGSAAWAQEAGAGCIAARDGRMVCPQPDAKCLINRTGDVICSTPGGGIQADRYGEVVCGPGACVRDERGDIFCATSPRGAAALDRYGKATCSGACVPAASAQCVIPQ